MIWAIGSGISLTINSLELEAQVDVLMEMASRKFPHFIGTQPLPAATVDETAVNKSLYLPVVSRV